MVTETRVDLLRHGEALGGRRLRGARNDDPLNERGWEQLRRATALDPGWEVVITSPQARCREFAQSFAAHGGYRLEVEERLREYDFGDWDGRVLEELWREDGARLAGFLGDPDRFTPPGGERAAAFRVRVRAARDALLARHEGCHLLVIGHGGVLRQWVADVLGAPAGVHGALDWPHAAMSRIRVVDDPPHPRHQTLLWHGRPADPEAPC